MASVDAAGTSQMWANSTTSALWAHLVRRDPLPINATPTAGSLGSMPMAPVDKTGTSMRILLHDTQANLGKFSQRVDKLSSGVEEAKTELVATQKLLQNEHEKVVGEVVELVNRAQGVLQKAIGAPAQVSSVSDLQKDLALADRRLESMDKKLDALQATNQIQAQILQSLQDQQGLILSYVSRSLPTLEAVPLRIDAGKNDIEDIIDAGKNDLKDLLRSSFDSLELRLMVASLSRNRSAASSARLSASPVEILAQRKRKRGPIGMYADTGAQEGDNGLTSPAPAPSSSHSATQDVGKSLSVNSHIFSSRPVSVARSSRSAAYVHRGQSISASPSDCFLVPQVPLATFARAQDSAGDKSQPSSVRVTRSKFPSKPRPAAGTSANDAPRNQSLVTDALRTRPVTRASLAPARQPPTRSAFPASSFKSPAPRRTLRSSRQPLTVDPVAPVPPEASGSKDNMPLERTPQTKKRRLGARAGSAAAQANTAADADGLSTSASPLNSIPSTSPKIPISARPASAAARSARSSVHHAAPYDLRNGSAFSALTSASEAAPTPAPRAPPLAPFSGIGLLASSAPTSTSAAPASVSASTAAVGLGAGSGAAAAPSTALGTGAGWMQWPQQPHPPPFQQQPRLGFVAVPGMPAAVAIAQSLGTPAVARPMSLKDRRALDMLAGDVDEDGFPFGARPGKRILPIFDDDDSESSLEG